MTYPFLLIECLNLEKYIHRLKQLIKYEFKVYVNVEHLSLRIFGNQEVLNRSKKLIDEFKNSDTQFLLPVSEYSRNAFKIENLLLFFESNFKVLLLLDDSILHLFGKSKRVELLNTNFLKYDRLVANENLTFILDEDDETRLSVMCSELDITLSKNENFKTRVFIYNILISREYLFSQMRCNDKNIAIQEEKLEKKFFPHKNKENNSLVVKNRIDTFSTASDSIEDKKMGWNKDNDTKFRTIIIDGNNVAFGHGINNFSYMGIKIAIDYFVTRGHEKIYALVPRYRQPFGGPIFEQLQREDRLKYTPSRVVNKVRETPYDDRFILDAAYCTNGVVLSNDQYRDLLSEAKYSEIINNRLLPYTFIGDHLIIPNDPKGPSGPSLDKILLNITTTNVPKPKKSRKKHKQNKLVPVNNVIAKRSQSAESTVLKGHQVDLFKSVYSILPDKSQLIKQIIIGNPQMVDVNTVVNFVLMATDSD